jgi:hypothetical protein
VRQIENKPPAAEAVNFAFAHIEELARLLHSAGHRDMAALLDAFSDLRELSLRRSARGGCDSLIGPGSDTLDYVMAQMAELAELMTRSGARDAALLFRTPGQLRAAAEGRSFADGPLAAGCEPRAIGKALAGGLTLAFRNVREGQAPLHAAIAS